MKAKYVRIVVGIALVAALFVGGAAAADVTYINSTPSGLSSIGCFGSDCINSAPPQNAITSDLSAAAVNNRLSSDSSTCIFKNNNRNSDTALKTLSCENSCGVLESKVKCIY